MFLGHTNPKLCISVNAIVTNLCKITTQRKKQLKVEILHNLKDFLNFISFFKKFNLKFVSFSKNNIFIITLKPKCQFCMKKFLFSNKIT